MFFPFTVSPHSHADLNHLQDGRSNVFILFYPFLHDTQKGLYTGSCSIHVVLQYCSKFLLIFFHFFFFFGSTPLSSKTNELSRFKLYGPVAIVAKVFGICTSTFVVALFTIVKSWKQPKTQKSMFHIIIVFYQNI